MNILLMLFYFLTQNLNIETYEYEKSIFVYYIFMIKWLDSNSGLNDQKSVFYYTLCFKPFIWFQNIYLLHFTLQRAVTWVRSKRPWQNGRRTRASISVLRPTAIATMSSYKMAAGEMFMQDIYNHILTS